MDEQTLKKLLGESLAPIKKDLAEVKEIQVQHTDILEKHTDILEKHTDILENRVLPSIVTTENEIKVYSDMYKLNNDNILKLDKRMNIAEEELGIEIPEELVLGEVR